RVNLISWLHEGIGDRVKITYSDTENNFEHIVSDNATTSPGNNMYEWMPDGEVPPTFSATITVELLGMETFSDDTEVYRCNSEHFMFLGQPSISLLTPGTNPVDPFGVEGEQMVVDSLYNVTWVTEGEIGFVRVSLCDANKNILTELKKKSHKPGIASKGSLNWKIPEYYGDLFFLFLEAGADIRTITATTFSEYPFRINRMPKVISPMQNDTGIGFLPCIEIEPLINATSYSVIITDTETNGDIYSNEFIADTGFFCLHAEMENELLPGKEYMLSAWAVIDTIQSYGTKTTFRTGENVPDGFSIIEPLDGDTLVEPENTFTWAHATGAMGYHLKITHLNNVIFEEGYSRADTQAVVNFGNVMYSDTLFCEITAHNDFGVNVSTISFYKKFRTGVENIAFKSTCNTKYGLKVVPNPVSEVSMVEFVLPNRGNAFLIKFKLFSSNGKQLFEGNEMMLNSGKHSFNLERLFSDKGGLYFLSLWVDGDLETTGVFFE
ncbi:MAG: hypothetical protein JW798_16470, partial [Prolixibacteraceae bacterium]|nr:hypothetical protein [Prolixibacteraceae bacterium]